MNLEDLQRECDYDPEGDSSVDSLIDYKNALEDRVMAMETDLLDAIRRAERVLEMDNLYWEAVATGQDTEEAEASGVLAGQIDGLRTALALLNGEDNPFGRLDLYVDDERERIANQYVSEVRKS